MSQTATNFDFDDHELLFRKFYIFSKQRTKVEFSLVNQLSFAYPDFRSDAGITKVGDRRGQLRGVPGGTRGRPQILSMPASERKSG